MKKKTSNFTIDKVSEDSFYGNLLLGLPKFLEKSHFIIETTLIRCPPATSIDILSWEHSNGVLLTNELKNFYASTNGFFYTYLFCQDYDKRLGKNSYNIDNCIVGRIHINSLEKLARMYGYETKNVEKIEKINNKYQLSLSPRSKVFELTEVDPDSKVVLVYLNAETDPSIWLLTKNRCFSYIARDFITYFRMCIAHLGAPGWQYAVSTEETVPEYSQEMFNIIAPGILYDGIYGVKNQQPEITLNISNVIEPRVFNLTYVSYIKERASSIATSTNTKASKSKKKVTKVSLKNRI